jgi:hypothetical protein
MFATAKSGRPVAVDVADADGSGVIASSEGDLGGEGGGGGSCGGGVEQDDGAVAVAVRHSYVWEAVAVDVADADVSGAIVGREVNFGGEA